jgi:hypothetical protein
VPNGSTYYYDTATGWVPMWWLCDNAPTAYAKLASWEMQIWYVSHEECQPGSLNIPASFEVETRQSLHRTTNLNVDQLPYLTQLVPQLRTGPRRNLQVMAQRYGILQTALCVGERSVARSGWFRRRKTRWSWLDRSANRPNRHQSISVFLHTE